MYLLLQDKLLSSILICIKRGKDALRCQCLFYYKYNNYVTNSEKILRKTNTRDKIHREGENMKKILIIIVMFVALLALPFVYAAGKGGGNGSGANFSDPTVNLPGAAGTSTGPLNRVVGNVWSTGVTIVQVVSLGLVVFSGIRYMFASADKKADIKRGLSYLAIGAMFVFSASTIARFVVNTGDHII